MNTPEPAREIDTLLDRLVAIVNHGETVTDTQLAQLEWQAKKLLRTDPAPASMALGLLAVVRADETAAEHAFQGAARKIGWTPLLRMNYAAMLNSFHRPDEALTQTLQVIEQRPEDLSILALDQAARRAHAAGRLHLAHDLLNQICSMNALSDNLQSFSDGLGAILETADALGLTDEVMASIQQPAWAAIREMESANGKTIRISDNVVPGERVSVLRTYWLPVSKEEGWKANRRMKAIWAESDDTSPIDDFCPIIIGRGEA